MKAFKRYRLPVGLLTLVLSQLFAFTPMSLADCCLEPVSPNDIMKLKSFKAEITDVSPDRSSVTLKIPDTMREPGEFSLKIVPEKQARELIKGDKIDATVVDPFNGKFKYDILSGAKSGGSQ
jgi:hypothetical protein